MSGARDPAAARFAAIQMIRLGGALFVVLGLLIANRRIEALADVPVVVGWVLAGIGLLDFFFFPKLLARRWRSPRP